MPADTVVCDGGGRGRRQQCLGWESKKIQRREHKVSAPARLNAHVPLSEGRSLLGNPVAPCPAGQPGFSGTVLITLHAFSLGRQMQLRSWGVLLARAEITSKNILPVQADWCKEGAEENPSVRVALPGQQGQPAGRLLDHFWHGLVLQQVGNPHLGVADIVAQGHVVWNGCAAGGSPQVARPGSWRAPEQQAHQETQQPWAARP